jgi:hypothetical protein
MGVASLTKFDNHILLMVYGACNAGFMDKQSASIMEIGPRPQSTDLMY